MPIHGARKQYGHCAGLRWTRAISDEPGPRRRVALATFDEYEEFVERLPRYLNDVICDLEARVGRTQAIEASSRRIVVDVRSTTTPLGRHAAKQISDTAPPDVSGKDLHMYGLALHVRSESPS